MFKALVYGLARLVFKLLPRRPVMNANINRLLVVKLCCIGDILFTTPLLRALRENFPRMQIGYMVSSWCQELVANDPRVSTVIQMDAYERVGIFRKIKLIIKTIRSIRQGKFDAAIILHRSPFAGILAALAGVPIRIGFDWQGEGFAHTVAVPFRVQAHEIDRDLDCIRPLNAEADGQNMELAPPADAEALALAFLEQYHADPKAGPLIALFPAGGVNPGTTMVTKRWPEEGFRETARELMRKFNARILLVGNRADVAVGDALAGNGPWEKPLIRAEGKTSLLMLAALLKQCALFIGGDSGPLHMAAAVGIPTISIFGPTDPALLAPRGAWHKVIRVQMACSPCYNPVTVREKDVTVCQEGTLACMHQVAPAEVVAAAEEFLFLKGYNRR